MQLESFTSSALRTKFYQIIETMTPKELRYITPKLLFEELLVSEQETTNLLDSLVLEGVLKRKYIFDCPNDNCEEKIITLDENITDLVQCEYCERTFEPSSNLELLNEICYELNTESSKKENENYGVNIKKYFEKKELSKLIVLPNIEKEQYYDNTRSSTLRKVGENMKVFISHSEKDEDLVRFLINLLEGMGVPKNKEHIFCSSYAGFGVDCGKDILEYIKNEFVKDEILVLYVVTQNFLDSKACLCEMGGAWVLSKTFIPLIVPPASFDAIKGSLLNPNVKGIKLEDYFRYDELMESVTKEFSIDVDYKKWNNAKNDFIKNYDLIKKRYNPS